jgi:CRP-like cAMP-binding protein
MNTYHYEKPPILEGCAVLPPMHQGNGLHHRHQGDTSKAKGKPARRKTGDRFAVANAFADYGARLVDTTAQAVWWILWRETKPDGLARVSFGRLADCIGRSRRTVVRGVGRLVKAGLLTVVRRGNIREGPSTYRSHGVPKCR